MMDDIYHKTRVCGNIPETERYDADARPQAHSKLCGSRVKIWLKMDGDLVSDLLKSRPVRLGRRASPVIGPPSSAPKDEIRQAREDMPVMLKADGEDRAGGSRTCDTGNLLRSLWRPCLHHVDLDAAVDAIGQVEAKRRN